MKHRNLTHFCIHHFLYPQLKCHDLLSRPCTNVTSNIQYSIGLPHCKKQNDRIPKTYDVVLTRLRQTLKESLLHIFFTSKKKKKIACVNNRHYYGSSEFLKGLNFCWRPFRSVVSVPGGGICWKGNLCVSIVLGDKPCHHFVH